MILQIIVNCAILTLVYILTKDITSKYIALIPTIISAVLLWTIELADINALIGLLLIMLAALIIFHYYDRMANKNSQLRGIVPMGIFIGLLAIIRIDMASYMYGLFFWAMFWAGMADVEGLKLTLPNRAIRGFGQGVFFTTIVVATLVPFVAYYISQGTIGEVLDTAAAVFVDGYRNMKLPNPLTDTLFSIIYYSPMLVVLVSVAMLIVRNRRRILRANTPLFWKEMLIMNLCWNIFNYATLTPDIAHTVPSMIFASMLLPLFLRTK
ncbi:MAG: hypothetical protein LBO69_02220 [Ignavibacteria bacterium]|jgi:hypothetical protein|nr:hypothetical protein [Ignavibacteria bacterium]